MRSSAKESNKLTNYRRHKIIYMYMWKTHTKIVQGKEAIKDKPFPHKEVLCKNHTVICIWYLTTTSMLEISSINSKACSEFLENLREKFYRNYLNYVMPHQESVLKCNIKMFYCKNTK